MNTLEHLMFILNHTAPRMEKEELLERINELLVAAIADDRDDSEVASLQRLNAEWSQRYLPPMRDYPSLYVMQTATTGYYKVGKAIDPESRLRGLQTGNPFALEIVHLEHGEDDDEASRWETMVHEILDPHHLRGEWFDCSLDQIRAAIEQAKARLLRQAYEPIQQALNNTEGQS